MRIRMILLGLTNIDDTCFFFFSSRRRHTRLQGDWSSDVCSSDLVFDYDMDKREAKLLKRTEILGGYDASRYQSERLYATAADGTRIPVSLVYRKDRKSVV